MLFRYSLLTALLSIVGVCASVRDDDYAGMLTKVLRERDHVTPGRALKAATSVSRLRKRQPIFTTVNQVELSYSEYENLDNESNFGATIRCNTSAPTLLLEDFEHLTDSIFCRPGQIVIKLLSGVDSAPVESTLLSLIGDGLIITSHDGCNDHGERKIFKASNMNVDSTHLSFVIDVAEASWKGCCKHFDVAMYHTSEGHTLRPYGKLHRRQEDSSDATPTSSTNLPTYSFPEPTATFTDSVNTLDLNHSADPGQSLIPFDNSTLLSCTNCSTFGTLDFSFLSFSLQNLTDIPDLLAESGIELGDVFQGGELEIIAHGMGARVELLTNVTGEHVLEVPLFAIPLLYRILIKGIGVAGLLYIPALVLDYKVDGSIGFTYGFEIKVPDESRLFIDLTQLGNSSVEGFQDTSLTAIPFQSSIDIDAAIVDVSLRHNIQVGFEFDLSIASLRAGVYLDLPKYRTEFVPLAGVDEECTSLATSQSDDKEVAETVLNDVLQVKRSANWQIGLSGVAEAAFGLFGGSFDVSIENGTLNDLESLCMNYNSTTASYTDAKSVVEEAKKSGALRSSPSVCAMGWMILLGFVMVVMA